MSQAEQTASGPKHNAPKASMVTRLDGWMDEHEANPRFGPFLAWIILAVALPQGTIFLGDKLELPISVAAWLNVLIYAAACGLLGWMLWRYRRRTTELTIRFHWSAITSGLFLVAAWIALGWAIEGEWLPRISAIENGRLLGTLDTNAEPHHFQELWAQSPMLYWTSLHLRFVGMVMIVPLFEELFSRSLCTRMFSNARKSAIGFVQVLEDFPLIGDVLLKSNLTKKSAEAPPMFTEQFRETPFGKVTFFAFIASTVIFMISHAPRDWAGCVVCGAVWCGMVAWTNRASLPANKRLGLGPVVWSHAITNGLLWWYSWGTGDWQFL